MPHHLVAAVGGVPKVIDFGLARRLGSGILPHGTGQVFEGSAKYAAPEALLCKGGPPSDVWSSAMVALECYCGGLPWDGPVGWEKGEVKDFIALIRDWVDDLEQIAGLSGDVLDLFQVRLG